MNKVKTPDFQGEHLWNRLGWAKENSEFPIIWEREGINEIGKRPDTGQVVIKIDPRYFRPTEVDQLLGDSRKAKIELGWEPKIKLRDLICEMIKNDLNEAQKESFLLQKGYSQNPSIQTIPTIMDEN